MFLSKHRQRLVKALAHEGNEDRNVALFPLLQKLLQAEMQRVHPDVPGGDAGFPVLKR